MTTRTDWVDYAKAIGIILVVYGHVARGLYNAGIDLPVSLYNLADSIIYSFHMPLFFFLSGLFFYDSFSKRGGKKLVFSKVDTIFYPYLIWSVIQGSIEVLLSNYTNGSVSFAEIFTLLWDPRAQFWFLYALFFVFSISAIAYSVIPKKYSLLFFLFAVLLYLITSILPPVRMSKFLSYGLVFLLFGIIFNMYVKVDRLSAPLPLIGLFFIFILSQWYFHGYLSLRFTNKGIESLLLALISIVFVVSLSGYLAKKNFHFLAYIGSASMAIYLMHILAGSGIRIIFSQLGIDDFYAHLLLGCLGAILLPLAGLEIINRCKIPYIFSAPVSNWCSAIYNKVLPRTNS